MGLGRARPAPLVKRKPLKDRGALMKKVLKRGSKSGSASRKHGALIPGLPTCSTSSVKLGPLRQWEQAMRRHVDKKNLPGFSSCVIHRGEVVHISEYGYADIEQRKHFTKDSIVRVYCITKTLIAIGILILKERGQLKLTDPVYKYIPSFKKLYVVSHGNTVSDVPHDAPNIAKDFTILRLLTHTAGCGYAADFGEKATGGVDRMLQPMLEAIDRREITTLAQYCGELAKLPLRHKPGKDLNYGSGHDVLARILEIVSGKTLDAFLKAELFQPLGMSDTGFFVPHRKSSRLAGLYCNAVRAARMSKVYKDQAQPRPSGKFLNRIDGSKPSESNWIEGRSCGILSGNGILGSNMSGLVSTLSDMARFFTMILNGGVLGNHRILQTSTVHEWCFKDLLALPHATGKKRRTGQCWSGWSALGERGMKRIKRDPKPKSDEYEEGEVAMGGAAQTTWSVNPVRDTVQLFFTQALDSDLWRADRTTKSGATKASPGNLTAALRKAIQRDGETAALRRGSL
jgi:CubicO group peptidase (beta-lactamase class C family)